MSECVVIRGGKPFSGLQGLSYFEGCARMRYGEGLAEELEVASGDFLYIPPGMPHQPFNASDEPCRAVIARTDANEQESVVLLDVQ